MEQPTPSSAAALVERARRLGGDPNSPELRAAAEAAAAAVAANTRVEVRPADWLSYLVAAEVDLLHEAQLAEHVPRSGDSPGARAARRR